MDDPNEEYKTGYRRPPEENRFAKGHSGNPKGRPKGAKNLATTFREVTQELIHVKENGQNKTMTKLEAIMRQLVSKAMSGDLKAMKEILQLNRIFEELAEKGAVDGPDAEKEEAVLRSFLKRVKEAQTDNEQKPIARQEGTSDDTV